MVAGPIRTVGGRFRGNVGEGLAADRDQPVDAAAAGSTFTFAFEPVAFPDRVGDAAGGSVECVQHGEAAFGTDPQGGDERTVVVEVVAQELALAPGPGVLYAGGSPVLGHQSFHLRGGR